MWYFLKDDEQVLVSGLTKRWVINGPATPFVAPLVNKVERRKALSLSETDYVRVHNSLSGETHNLLGPGLYFLGAYETVVNNLKVLALEKGEYLRIRDSKTGQVRLAVGETSVIFEPTEEILDGKAVKKGVHIDEDTSVIVRNIETGQQRLIREAQVYIPFPVEELLKVQPLIKLEDHETVVIRQKDGSYRFRHGTEDERSFFLEPYSELVTFRWASGIHKESRDLKLTKLDRRPKFMWYDFEVRTADNVELMIGITFFWQIVDVLKMVATTDDTTGDVCAHSRSLIIQAVSRVTLEDFLANFNRIIHEAVIASNDPFYTERGVRLHAVEVRSIACKDEGTQAILNEIIQETTNRLNRLQKQESENEVRLRQIEGQIEAEQRRGDLLELQRQAKRQEALADGEAEADKVRSFFAGLSELPEAERLEIYQLLRKTDALRAVSGGKAQVFFTPNDVNLSIESKS